MELSSQYDVLDVSDILSPGAVLDSQRGVTVALKIKSTKWYNDFSKDNYLLLERLVDNLWYSRTRSEFVDAWEDFKEWADDHYVWVNEE